MSALEKQDTYNQVIAIIADKLAIDVHQIQGHSTLTDLGADSLDMVEIVMKLEEHFGIEIEDEKAEQLVHIDDLVTYIHGLRTLVSS